jgi:hypothetical protein
MSVMLERGAEDRNRGQERVEKSSGGQEEGENGEEEN